MTSSKARIDVVFSADSGYVPHLATAVTSLLETNHELVSRVWVITDAGDNPKFRRFQKDIAERYEVSPIALDVDSSRFESVYVSGHVSWATYSRFLLGELLPGDVRDVLYLDSDLIVVGSLEDMLADDGRCGGLDEPIVRAVARDSGRHLEQFGFRSQQYFNAGVLLVDLDAWRREGIQAKLFRCAEDFFGKLHLWDQDVLNLVLEGRWSELGGRFNETAVYAKSPEARIIHFVGGTKPWMVGGRHPYRKEYRLYRSLTPFWPYFPQGLMRFLRKRFLPRSFQRPRRTLRRLGRRIRRLLGGIVRSP